MRALALAAVIAGLGASVQAQPQGPMSAIGWLSDSADLPPGVYPVSPLDGAWGDSGISMQTLGATSPESVGLFPAARVGLPADIWGPTPAPELAALIAALPTDTLPALRDLTYRLLLAEFAPPVAAESAVTGGSSVFLSARIERLVALGALDQAAALLDTLGSPSADLREERFRIALLLGDENTACRSVTRTDLDMVSAGPRVFCLARQGNWTAANALFQEQAALIPPLESALLARFLEVEVNRTLPPMPPIERPGPLAWHLLEAIGEPIPTQGLPLAFAHADLRGTAGWRAQIEAAERLVRSGALPPTQLLGLYTERSPAASGGIWERVRAVQRLERALAMPELPQVPNLSDALVAAWARIAEAELELALAALFGPALRSHDLAPGAMDTLHALQLLGDDYEAHALTLAETGAAPRWLAIARIARGLSPDPGTLGAGTLADAVQTAFADPLPPLPEASAQRLAEGRLGEDLLRHLLRLGPTPDPRYLAEALVTLRHLRMEDIARRTALQALLLDRRG